MLLRVLAYFIIIIFVFYLGFKMVKSAFRGYKRGSISGRNKKILYEYDVQTTPGRFYLTLIVQMAIGLILAGFAGTILIRALLVTIPL